MSLAIMANIVATKDIQLPKTSDNVPNHLKIFRVFFVLLYKDKKNLGIKMWLYLSDTKLGYINLLLSSTFRCNSPTNRSSTL